MSSYVRYPTGTSCGALTAVASEPIIPTGTTTIIVKNQTGSTMTLIGAQGFATTISGGGATLDIQNGAGATHLAAAIVLVAGSSVGTTTITGAAGTTVVDNADVHFVFANAVGGVNLADGQGTVTYTVQFAST